MRLLNLELTLGQQAQEIHLALVLGMASNVAHLTAKQLFKIRLLLQLIYGQFRLLNSLRILKNPPTGLKILQKATLSVQAMARTTANSTAT